MPQHIEKIRIKGLVQGVGFRPTVWKLAQQYHVLGEVRNDGDGVQIIAHSSAENIDAFIQKIHQKSPILARIDSIEREPFNDSSPFNDFSIIRSAKTIINTQIAADASTCPECLEDINDSNNRRFGYAFTNCTHCGPRLSIINNIPYDRATTSMSAFTQCSSCKKEYDNPDDRRFHAQPNACPECGPKLTLSDQTGKIISTNNPIKHVAELIQQGHIVAIKGIGGFQFACDASNQSVVDTLRLRKKRPSKAFALMAQSIAHIEQFCDLNQAEKQLLTSTAAPIVLLNKKENSKDLTDAIAPNQNTLGFMLPNSPLHHLLMQQLDQPIVLTSANATQQPQCIDNQQAIDELGHIADYFLSHNRDIVNRIDDSVLRIINHSAQFYRRARGYAPHSIPFKQNNIQTRILACGSELKNTFCLMDGEKATLSQHIGNLDNAQTYDDYCHLIALYQQLFQFKPNLIVVDQHPEYRASKWGKALADELGIPCIEVQHHHAHIAACLADNAWTSEQGKVIGVALDGLGYGDDNTLWGFELLEADYSHYERFARLKPSPLIGGNLASVEPWRNAFSHLVTHLNWQEISHQYALLEAIKRLNSKPLSALQNMIKNGFNSPMSSSCGRLFDAVAFMLGLCREKQSYEGQAAIELENLINPNDLEHLTPYSFSFEQNNNITEINPAPLWQGLLTDLSHQVSASIIASRFHLTLAQIICDLVKAQNLKNNITTVALSGGVFQNKTLLELCHRMLEQQSFTVLLHHQVPANDGGLSLGQAAIAAAHSSNHLETTLCV